MTLDILLCHDLYFLTMVEGENEDKDAHPASKAEKELLIFFKHFLRTCVLGLILVPLIASSWSPTGSMRSARYDFGATLLSNGKVLAAGGSSGPGNVLSSAEIYNPSTGSWTSTGSMHDGVHSAGFAVLSSSSSETKVLRAGGTDVYGVNLSTAEIFTASTGTWARTGSLNGGRAGFGIVKLTTANIFVAGGVASHGNVVLSTAEEYIVSSGTWQSRPSMRDARSRFRLVRLSNGDVLAAGGINLYSPLSTAEVYIP